MSPSWLNFKLRGRREGGLGWGTHVNPWLIHVNVWQKPLQYCKVITLQWMKINEKKKKKFQVDFMTFSPLSSCMLLSRFSRVRPRATPSTEAHQASLSLGFSRQEHWSGLPFPSPMHESEMKGKSLSCVQLSATPWTTRLLHPWDFPGKSTGVGRHCLLWSSCVPNGISNTNYGVCVGGGGQNYPSKIFQGRRVCITITKSLFWIQSKVYYSVV